MEVKGKKYLTLEKKIIQNLELCKIRHRTKCSAGLWIGPLVGLSAFVTLLREDSSYSEICLLEGLTGIGLLISCVCLYMRLAADKVAAKDFHVVYFLPAIVTSTLYLLVANKAMQFRYGVTTASRAIIVEISLTYFRDIVFYNVLDMVVISCVSWEDRFNNCAGLLVSVAWGSSVGSLSTWGVVQAMSYFPGSFTVGEATAVTHGIVLFLLSIATNIPLRYHLPPLHNNDIATVILQVGIWYVLSICVLCVIFPKLRQTAQFYALNVAALLLLVIPFLHVILDRSPIVWIFSFIVNKPTRIFLLVYWLLCFVLAWCFITHYILVNSEATSSDRKVFHAFTTMVFIPGIIWEPTFLYLVSGVALALFLMLELLRFFNLPPLGGFLEQGYSIFADEKDSFVSLTPLYLLCGLSFPLWMPATGTELLPLLSGVLTVGVGDAAASFVGSNWGKHKLTGSEKSIEGLIACIFSQMVFIFGLVLFGFIGDYGSVIKSAIAVVAVSVVEAKTEQVDNLVMPLLMYLCLLLL